MFSLYLLYRNHYIFQLLIETQNRLKNYDVKVHSKMLQQYKYQNGKV